MCKFKLIISMALLCGFTIANANTSAANELKNILAPIDTLKADFSQTVYSSKHKVLQNAHGTLEFKRPNLLRWEIKNPPSLIVTNGTKLWNYDIELEQVTVKVFSSHEEVSPASFLFDAVEKLQSNFAIDKLEEPALHCYKGVDSCFKLTPKKQHANFVSMQLGFVGNKLRLLNMLDHVGQTTMFVFSNTQANKTINDARFIFTPPVGVDVIGD